MSGLEILYPVFAMAVLTMFVSIILLIKNIRATLAKRVSLKFFALYQGEAPDDLLQARDHYKNLFELPVLFYLLCLLIYIIDVTTPTDVFLAWSFVLSRIIHSYIRATTNWVPHRFKAFIIGFLILFLHWSYFLGKIILFNYA